MILEVSHTTVRSVSEQYKTKEHNFEMLSSKYSLINVLTPDGILLYKYEGNSSTNVKANSLQSKLKQFTKKYIKGQLPVEIKTLKKEGYC